MMNNFFFCSILYICIVFCITTLSFLFFLNFHGLESLWKRIALEHNYIGRCYYYGQGFPKPDFQQAAMWLEKAANQDYDDAQYQLGLCYEKGQGVKQNPEKAREWYEKAAANGNNKAKQKIQ